MSDAVGESSLVAALLDRCHFPPAGTRVDCAVSGGPDSTALVALASAAGVQVTVHHVNHGIRAGSEADEAVVRAVAERFGAPVVVHRLAVTDGPNLEARARDARRRVLPPDALTGHTCDDQAETVLMFLLRGTGPEGLAGMDPARRPLLGLRRTETAAVCRELGLATVDDPMNDDPRFVRSRIRHELLPAMDGIAGRDVAPLLARSASLQRDLLAAVDGLAADLDPTNALAVAAAHPAVASTALRTWWRRSTGSSYAPDEAALGRILDVAAGRATSADVVGGWRVGRTNQRLRLIRPLGGPPSPG